MNAFNNINIILVEPSHPGNIGATARAMLNMGFSHLGLVNPLEFPSALATARAAGADSILSQAKVCTDLAQGLGESQFIVGTSARQRTLPIPLLSPREAAKKIAQESQQALVAILFGRERTGLTNEELALCHAHVNIPTNPNFSSLNLAAAVQVIAYECRLALLSLENLNNMSLREAQRRGNLAVTEQQTLSDRPGNMLASGEEMAGFYQHLWQMLTQIAFFKNKQSRQLKLRLQHIFNRARLDKTEYTILRGILTAIQKKLNSKYD